MRKALTVLVASVSVFWAASAYAQTQTPKAPVAAVKSAIPRTADGHPDLSGVYSTVQTGPTGQNVPMARPANCGTKEVYTSEDIANGLGGARGCGGNAPGGRGAGGGRGGAAAGRGAAAANIDPETGQPALAVHYDTAQFGLSGNTIVKATNMRTSILIGPEGKLPPVNAEGQQRQKNIAANRAHQWDGPETRPIGERCLSWPSEGPPMISAGYNADLQIVQGDGYVGVLQEMIHDARMIPTNGGPEHLSNGRSTMVRQLARPLGR